MNSSDGPEPATDEPIMCAIGDDGSTAALAFAGLEAQRTGARLHLVHVTNDPHGRRTDALLLDAMVTLHASHPGVTVTRDIIEGAQVATGLASTGRARHVVVEQSHHGWAHRLPSGSTADGVALKVTAPVLSVPAGWRGDGARPPVVTVAVQDADDVPVLVGLAASEADARALDLVVLHAASTMDVLQLDGLVREAAAPYPDLKVRIEVTSDRPVDAVVGASAGSTLLVVGRRHHEHAWGTHLGPVARRVLLDAACPVLLAPEAPASTRAATEHAAAEPVSGRRGAGPGEVMVAVGAGDAGGAVRFAVAEAVARGVGVHLVHVVRMPAKDGVSVAEAWRDAVAAGADVLTRAAAQARTSGGPDLGLSQRLVEQGGLVASLVAEGAQAGAIVVQHRRLSTIRRLLTWSVTNGMAARSDVAVIAVPEDWVSGPERVGCVVVGLQDADDIADVLPTAVDAASHRGLPVRIVHAGPPSARRDDAIMSAMESLRREQPGVSVHAVLEDGDPVDLLVGAVTLAELVVIGRRRSGLSRRSHLGPVAREVLDRSPFPVLLAPPAR